MSTIEEIQPFDNADLPPSPPGNLFLKNLPELKRATLSTLLRYTKEYGDIIRIRLGPRDLYFLNDPDHIKHVLLDNFMNFDKRTRGWNSLRPLFGEGLLTSDGQKWLQQRRTMQPAFHHQRIKNFISIFATETKRMVEKWRPFARKGLPLNVADEMMELTFRIVTATLFSEDLEKDEVETVGRALSDVLHCASENFARLWNIPLWVPTKNNLRARNALKNLDEIVYSLIRKRKESNKDYHDLLSLLMAAQDPETGKGMSDEEIRDQVMTIFMTGHETTAVSMTWAWYLLSKYPETEKKLNLELEEKLGGRDPQLEDLKNLEYTQRIFKETLRLYPPIWVISRRVIKEDRIGGYRIPTGATIFFSPYILHRNSNRFENPEEFDPDRFSSHKLEPPPPFTYIPFGGGPRLCIGRDFALMEAGMIIPIVAQNYRLKILPGHVVETDLTVTLRARYGMRMILEQK